MSAVLPIDPDTADIAGYKAYLAEFPQGVFAEFAQTELAALQAKTDNAAAATVQAEAVAQPSASTDVNTAEPGMVRFAEALTVGTSAILGKTLAQIVVSSPLFPPIEGLPEEYWKEKTCRNCHNWQRENLCEQAQVYLSVDAQRSLSKQHPFGGSFKRNLKVWAAGGCR